MPTDTRKQQQQTRAADPATRRTILAVGVLVVLVVGFFVLKPILSPSSPKGGDPATDIASLKAVQTYDFAGGQHTTDPVTYTETPPVGGPHDPVWQDCGAYSQQLRNENVVHSLEHGTVWITYRPGLPSAGVQQLRSDLGSVKNGKWILSPYPGQPTPVAVTVWNAQLDLPSASDPRLQDFLAFYGDGHTAPEAAMASCAGGKVVLASPGNP